MLTLWGFLNKYILKEENVSKCEIIYDIFFLFNFNTGKNFLLELLLFTCTNIMIFKKMNKLIIS